METSVSCPPFETMSAACGRRVGLGAHAPYRVAIVIFGHHPGAGIAFGFRQWSVLDLSCLDAASRTGSTNSSRGDVACFGNPDPVGMKVNYPLREETFDDDETTDEASSGSDRGEAS